MSFKNKCCIHSLNYVSIKRMKNKKKGLHVCTEKNALKLFRSHSIDKQNILQLKSMGQMGTLSLYAPPVVNKISNPVRNNNGSSSSAVRAGNNISLHRNY